MKAGSSSFLTGGIFGSNLYTVEVEKCYNFGIVEKGEGFAIGNVSGGNIIDCNYLENTAKQATKMPSVISVLMTDNEQVEWNGEMVDVWKEDTENINNGYPILFWQ